MSDHSDDNLSDNESKNNSDQEQDPLLPGSPNPNNINNTHTHNGSEEKDEMAVVAVADANKEARISLLIVVHVGIGREMVSTPRPYTCSKSEVVARVHGDQDRLVKTYQTEVIARFTKTGEEIWSQDFDYIALQEKTKQIDVDIRVPKGTITGKPMHMQKYYTGSENGCLTLFQYLCAFTGHYWQSMDDEPNCSKKKNK